MCDTTTIGDFRNCVPLSGRLRRKERQQAAMSDHSHFEELAALKAGGFLSHEELMELREHAKDSVACRETEQEFNKLVRSGLPLTVSPVREFLGKRKVQPDENIRARFLHRARVEGIGFSPDAAAAAPQGRRRVGFFVSTVAAAAAVILALVSHGTYWGRPASPATLAQQQFDQLKRENSALTASIAQLNDSLASGQRQIQDLRAQLGSASAAAEDLRRNGERARGEAERSSSQNVQLLDDSRNQEKLLAEAKDEAARLVQLRANDEASL